VEQYFDKIENKVSELKLEKDKIFKKPLQEKRDIRIIVDRISTNKNRKRRILEKDCCFFH
jgi:SMC interacting uncharacterized protein involved in chromosome segregation